MSDYAHAIAPPATTSSQEASGAVRFAEAVGDAAFAVASFGAKAAGGLAGGLWALATAPMVFVTGMAAAHRPQSATGDSAPDYGTDADDAVAMAAPPVHAVPQPDAALAPVTQAVRELEG